MIVARYEPAYYHFLRTGQVMNDAFLILHEYGPYKLTDRTKVKALSQLIVAIMLYLDEAGPHPT